MNKGTIKMKTFFVRALKTLAIGSVFLFSLGSTAQELLKPIAPIPAKDIGTTYTVEADTQNGGWILTAVNQYADRTQSEDEAYTSSLLASDTVHVSKISYKGLSLKPGQAKELEAHLLSGQGLLAGNLIHHPNPPGQEKAAALEARAAWVSPTKTQAIGPYLKVSSSGIVCITTPCPYFKVKLINNTYTVNYDALIFDRAELDRDQEARAWQAVSSDGLVLTGVRFFPELQTGTGRGISATKVFFPFPAKRPIRPL
jgi:hypothetical protein